MNILAINPGHNGSAAFLIDGELKFYIEEERLSRQKYDGNPFRGIMEAIPYGIDILVLGGTSNKFPSLPWTGEDPYSALVRKYCPNVNVINLGHVHHVGHAAGAFYNSGFDEALAIVVDGAGSFLPANPTDNTNRNMGYETESAYKCSYPADFKMLYKRLGGNSDTTKPQEKFDPAVGQIVTDSTANIVKTYEAVSEYLGFGFIEAGKTMGLAPYGSEELNIPDLLFNDKFGDKNYVDPMYPAGALINQNAIPSLALAENYDKKCWHHDKSKFEKRFADLAFSVQKQTQQALADLIRAQSVSAGTKNVVIAGGYGLNCVANYFLKKELGPEYNIFVDPISHDGGTALGLAKLIHYAETQETKKRPLETLYLGLERKENYSKISNGDFEKLGGEVTEVTNADVAKLIADKNIVTIFQGKSEAGPRALGNRSILYDPTDKNGKDHVNTVKGREWFRPFAGSMLHEHFEEWFETRGLEESPFMMYAMNLKHDKHGEVPAITHVDGSCRIQTVKREQNETYYDLINEFYKITNVPILFNTSFNLAGEPLVETLEDAINTIMNSDIEYLYLPEIGKLIKYSDNLSKNVDSEETQEEAA